MKIRVCLLFALLISPITASAQTIVSHDPDPASKRCENPMSAVHDDGSVVMVDYHGQWYDHDDGKRTQNGGPDWASCATDRIVRRDGSGRVIWSIELTDTPGPHGITRADKITSLVAVPDGSTIITSAHRVTEPAPLPRVVRVDAHGNTLWTLKTKFSPTFAWPEAHLGDGDTLIVSYAMTNYAYEGGRFEIDGGRHWKLRESERKTIVSRIGLEDGKLLWERPIRGLVGVTSADHGEVLTLSTDVRHGATTDFRYEIKRYGHDGKLRRTVRTSWFPHEGIVSSIRYGDLLLVTTARENVRDGRVVDRVGGYRVFTLDGKEKHSREVSDQTVLAKVGPGAPIRMFSPTNCRRDIVEDFGCLTDAVQVVTLDSPTAEGKRSQIQVPDARFGYYKLQGVSTSTGLWLTGQSYYRAGPGEPTTAPAVTVKFAADGERRMLAANRKFVWHPLPPEKTKPVLELMF